VLLLEEFDDGEKRKAGRYVVYYQRADGWKDYSISQAFGMLSEISKNQIEAFPIFDSNWISLGNSCVYVGFQLVDLLYQ
jgi:hypothetical protein